MNEASSPLANTAHATGRDGRSVFVSAVDGLRLHVREYGLAASSSLPVICLPGLARTTADFATLAPALADGQPPRRVIAIDLRGRGQSEYDADPQNYNLAVELADVVTVLTSLQIGRAVFVGSSRGGILTHVARSREIRRRLPAPCCTISVR